MATTLDPNAPTVPTYSADEAADASTIPQFAPSAQPTAAMSLSIASLVLGVASFIFGFSFVVPAAGLILGIMALRREPAGKTLAVVGIVTSALNLGWVVLVALGLTLLIPFAGFILPWTF